MSDNVPATESPAAPKKRRHEVLLVGGAAIGTAVVTFVLMAVRAGHAPAISAASADVTVDSPPATAPPAPMSADQTWSTANRAFWLGNRRGAAFELLAENKVHTWFGPTQPVLVVRCVSRTMDAFVYTRSATRIEPQAEGKTVTVSVDEEPAKTERWSDSEDRTALFAPDGAAFARRLLHAQTLRFGYSPHNADDVVAQFHVAGLAKVVEPVAKECGWKP